MPAFLTLDPPSKGRRETPPSVTAMAKKSHGRPLRTFTDVVRGYRLRLVAVVALSSLLIGAVVVNLAESVDVDPVRAGEVLEASRHAVRQLTLTPDSADDTVAIHLFGGIERILIVMRRMRAGTEKGSTEVRLAPSDPVEVTVRLGIDHLFSGALSVEVSPGEELRPSSTPWVVGLLSVGAVAMALGVGFGVHAGSLASNPDALIDDALETRVRQYDDARVVMWLSGGIGAGLILSGVIVALAGP